MPKRSVSSSQFAVALVTTRGKQAAQNAFRQAASCHDPLDRVRRLNALLCGSLLDELLHEELPPAQPQSTATVAATAEHPDEDLDVLTAMLNDGADEATAIVAADAQRCCAAALLLQSCWRRRRAQRQLLQLRREARERQRQRLVARVIAAAHRAVCGSPRRLSCAALGRRLARAWRRRAIRTGAPALEAAAKEQQELLQELKPQHEQEQQQGQAAVELGPPLPLAQPAQQEPTATPAPPPQHAARAPTPPASRPHDSTMPRSPPSSPPASSSSSSGSSCGRGGSSGISGGSAPRQAASLPRAISCGGRTWRRASSILAVEAVVVDILDSSACSSVASQAAQEAAGRARSRAAQLGMCETSGLARNASGLRRQHIPRSSGSAASQE